MSELDKEVEKFFTDMRKEVAEHLDNLGQRAVDANIAEGDYKNHTYKLRRSNYHKADADGLELGNSAPYASEVESRGYNVIDSGVKLIMEDLQ